MHCHICDSDSDTVVQEGDSFSPCSDCQAAIFECLMGYPDATVLEVDEIIEEEFDGTTTDYISGPRRSDDPRSSVLDAGSDETDC